MPGEGDVRRTLRLQKLGRFLSLFPVALFHSFPC